jgi:hypothetical protein
LLAAIDVTTDRGLFGSGAFGSLINQQPSFTASNPASVLEDEGELTINGFATFDPGDPSESSQNVLAYHVTSISNPALFAIAPAIDTSGNLTYSLAANAFGTSTFLATVQDDGGTEGGGGRHLGNSVVHNRCEGCQRRTNVYAERPCGRR